MSENRNEAAADDVRRALALLEDFRARQHEGRAEDVAAFLDSNGELRSVLESLLAAQTLQRDPSEASGSFANYFLPRPGLDFGHYHLEERLGHGASGTVFLATDTKLHRRVALKILHPELMADRRSRDRFWREIRAASVLDHPNICAIYDSGVVGQVPFLAMRYVAGETLAARIAKARDARQRMVGFGGAAPGSAGATPVVGATPMTEELTPGSRGSIEAMMLRFEQLALALHYVHQQGLVHRDVKPANIMLDVGDVPVLLDFGLARNTVGASSVGPAADAGTPMYLAPEQVAGIGSPGPAADLYALGVTLYECATLRHPFEGTTQNELFDAILHRTPVPMRQWNPRLPRDLQVVLAKATDKDPGRRYVSALAFAEDLRRIRQFQPIQAKPVSRIVRVDRWVRRNPLAACFLALAIAVTVASSVLLVAFVHDRGRIELQATRALLEIAEQQAKELVPPFPDKLPALRAFHARFDGTESLAERLERVRAAKAELEKKARVATAAERLASRRYRELSATLQSLRNEGESHVQLNFGVLLSLVKKAKDLLGEHMAFVSTGKARLLENLQPSFERQRQKVQRQVTRVEAELATAGAFAFESPEDAREHDQLIRLENDLLAACSEDGVLQRMKRALETAEESQRHLVEFAAAWQHARDEVRADPRYGGLDLTPQDGLVPLGRDVEGGLQAFWHPASGDRPEVVDGRISMAPGSGLVFLLVPQGTFDMGQMNNYTTHKVALDAFFASKFEASQGQWALMGGGQPSMMRSGTVIEGMTVNDLHPVESVSSVDALKVLHAHGLDCPTEAQWEYFARAGTNTPTWLGTPEAMVEMLEEEAKAFGSAIAHMPVDKSRPNPFGLHFVFGNVTELCRDRNISYDVAEHAPGDGLLLSFMAYEVAARGGSMADGKVIMVAGRRSWQISYLSSPLHGIRPVRALRRSSVAR